MEDPAITSDGSRLHAAAIELEQAQQKVETPLHPLGRAGTETSVTSESLG